MSLRSWSWLARRSRSHQIKLWLRPTAGPGRQVRALRARLNIVQKKDLGRRWPGPVLGGFHHWHSTVLPESRGSDVYYRSN